MIDTIVVGAGAAGLMAARELSRANRTVVVLEARSRIGGRIHTVTDPGSGIPIELGAEFVHGDAPETTRLLDEARLATVPVMDSHLRYTRAGLAAMDGEWARLSQVFGRMSAARKIDRSFQAFLDDRPGGTRLAAARALARSFVEGFDAADASRISERALAEAGDPLDGATEARRIVRGYGALVEYLARESTARVHLNARVRRIAWSDRGVRVHDAHGGEHRARTVVVTVPLPMLQDASIVFEPEVPALRRAAGQLEMGHVMRVNVLVHERFWERAAHDLSYLHAPTRPVSVWWTQLPLRVPLLVGWSGGPPALAVTRAGDVEETARAELAQLFSLRRRMIDRLVEGVLHHDWSTDVHARGAYSYVAIGGASAPRRLSRAIGGTVFIAGEAGETENAGTVEAAIASGKRAARQVLRQLSA